ncbi:unc-13 [Sarcoptes scabiei]|nr:unc-13 [Sarcoptes scabiei]
MPKKLGVNTKALEAKARKDSAKKIKEELIQKQKEDEYWRDDDRLVNRKLERQQQREAKKQEVQQRKAQNRAAYEEEQKNVVKTVKNKEQSNPKMTRSHIQNLIEKQKKKEEPENNIQREPTHLEMPLEENINHLIVDGEEARNVDEAISILSLNEPEIDKHPERRMRAAWLAYEEKHLPRLKQENPSFRLSQLREMLRKEFNKSAENPINQQGLIKNKH